MELLRTLGSMVREICGDQLSGIGSLLGYSPLQPELHATMEILLWAVVMGTC